MSGDKTPAMRGAALRSRRGVSVPEVLVALIVGLLVVHLGLATLASMRTAQTGLSARSDALVALRVARHVLRRELRHGRGGLDWWAYADSIALRAFRGTALVCPGAPAADEILVSYRGDRLPEPAKDSVLLLMADGSRQVRGLRSVSTPDTVCGVAADTLLALWRLEASVPAGGVLARIFERGSYHLSGSALRYRTGGGGRQPLTAQVWRTPPTGWAVDSTAVSVSLVPRIEAPSRSWGAFLAWVEGP
jgi:hypothetical protein